MEKDEIDLKELFSQIWSRKWKIAIFSFLVTTLVTTILIMTPNSYRSYITLLPQGEQSSSGDFEALAGLAGIRVGAATVSPYNTMSSILKDDSLHEYIVQKYALLERVENQENLVFPFELQFENSKDIDISEAERLFDIYKYLSETVSLSEDTKSGIITLSVEMQDRFLTKELADIYLFEITDRVRKLDMKDLEKKISFYENELLYIENIELQATITKLISTLIQKKVLAKASEYYLVQKATESRVAFIKDKVKPKRAIIIVVSFIASIILAIFFILFIDVFRNPK